MKPLMYLRDRIISSDLISLCSPPKCYISSILQPDLQNSWRQTARRNLNRAFYKRHFSNSRRRRENESTSSSQAHPLGDFYSDLLNTPLSSTSQATSSPNLPDWVATGGRKDIEERAKKLFGSIEGSGYQRKTSDTPDATWRTINGVPIPPRPDEPENCCMSGCVHCVWDDYRDDVESWAARLHEAQAKSRGQGISSTPKIDLNRDEVSAASGSMDDDGGGSESLWQEPSAGLDSEDSLFQGIPIGIREFMATEKRIRDRKKSKKGIGK